MSRDRLLALDLGGTRVRALLVDEEGRVEARAERPLASRCPAPGRVEHDPVEMERDAVAVLAAVLARARVGAERVAGLGIVTQRATVVAFDARDGSPLSPAISWQDQRTAAAAARWAERGLPVGTLASATKFEWLLREVEAVRRAARSGHLRLATLDAWLGHRLSDGAAFVTDPGQAACTGLYDAAGEDFAPGMLDLFGLERDWLPTVCPSSAVVAEIPAARFGAAIPLAARAGDQQAASFAQGVHRPGEAKLTLGTAAMLDVHCGARTARPRNGALPLPLWSLPDGERAFCLEATLVTAGAAVDWFAQVGLLPRPDALDALAAEVPDSLGVAFVPALQGLGAPYADDAARGILLGLTRGTGRPHLARALVDGLAQRCVDLCDAVGLAAGPLRVDGGLARSETLLQAIADLSGRSLLRAAETETTASGAAQLAGLAVGCFATPAACRATLAEPTRIEPVLDVSEREARRAEFARAVARARSG